MKKHFVEFLSPGTFVSEITTREISSWDVAQALILARDIRERYSARPYGFRFLTRERSDTDLDSQVTRRSGTYFLGGTVLTLAEIQARSDPRDRILISNMQRNGWDRVIENNNSWKITLPLNPEDQILDWNHEDL